jgi:hypothetical protein
MPAPVITPAGPLTKRGKDVQAFTATNGVTTWTAPEGGTLSGTSSSAATWTAPNKTGTFTVRATNASGTTSVTINVTAVVPFVPDYECEQEDGKNFLPFTPDKGPRQAILLGEDNKFPFLRNTAKKTERDEMRQFHADNYFPGILVYFTPPFDSEQSWELDSNFKSKPRLNNLWSYAFTLLRRT